MSVVAKILVVLNLVLAIVFLGMASTFLGQQESWKVRHDAKVKEMGDEIAKWKQNYDSVNTNYQLQLQETARLQTENAEKTTLIQAKEEEYQAVEEKHNQLLASTNKLAETERQLQASIDDLNADKNRLTGEKEAAMKEKRQAIEDMNNAITERKRLANSGEQKDNQIGELEKRIAMLADQVEKLGLTVKAYEDEVGPLGPYVGVPTIKAKINAVSGKENIVLLSVGRDDGVKVGFKFVVYRGTEYVGTVVVKSVEKDYCAAASDKGIEKLPIQVGDDATTRF